MKPPPLPPFQIDYSYLTGATDGLEPVYRLVTPATVQMCIAALDAMRYNRYWIANGEYLTDGQIASKNDIVDNAILELLEAVTITEGQLNSVTDCNGCGPCENDCEEQMSNPIILRLGGVPYLAEVCCGQETNLFQLTGTTAQVSDDGTILVPTTSDIETDMPATYEVSSDNLACYAGKATEYMLQRAADFVTTMRSIAESGLDLLSSYDEAADVLLVVADLLGAESNDLTDIILGADAATIENAIKSTTTAEALEARWEYPGSINRLQLISWVSGAPWTIDGVRVKPLLIYWASCSILAGYNKNLAVLSQECETGRTLDDINPGHEYYEREIGGLVYPVYVYHPGEVIEPGGASAWVPPIADDGVTVVAMYTHMRTSAGGNSEIHVRATTEGGYANTGPSTDVYYSSRGSALAALDAVGTELLEHAPDIRTNQAAGAPSIYMTTPYYSSVNLITVVAIGDALP